MALVLLGSAARVSAAATVPSSVGSSADPVLVGPFPMPSTMVGPGVGVPLGRGVKVGYGVSVGGVRANGSWVSVAIMAEDGAQAEKSSERDIKSAGMMAVIVRFIIFSF